MCLFQVLSAILESGFHISILCLTKSFIRSERRSLFMPPCNMYAEHSPQVRRDSGSGQWVLSIPTTLDTTGKRAGTAFCLQLGSERGPCPCDREALVEQVGTEWGLQVRQEALRCGMSSFTPEMGTEYAEAWRGDARWRCGADRTPAKNGTGKIKRCSIKAHGNKFGLYHRSKGEKTGTKIKLPSKTKCNNTGTIQPGHKQECTVTVHVRDVGT